MLGTIMLVLSVALTAIAAAQRAEPQLLAAVIAYAGTGVYLIVVEPWLFPASLAIALVLGLAAAVRTIAVVSLPEVMGETAFFIDGA